MKHPPTITCTPHLATPKQVNELGRRATEWLRKRGLALAPKANRLRGTPRVRVGRHVMAWCACCQKNTRHATKETVCEGYTDVSPTQCLECLNT